MDAEHWIYRVTLDGVDHFVACRDGGEDDARVFTAVTDDGCLVWGEDPSVVADWILQRGLPIDPTETPDDFVSIDLDNAVATLGRGSDSDAALVLDAWNFLEDMVQTAGGSFDFDDDKSRQLAEKLFWALNLSSVTPQGQHYDPKWQRWELDAIRLVIVAGVDELRRLWDSGSRQ